MRKFGTAKTIYLLALLLLAVSVVLAVVSLFPVATGEEQSWVLIEDSFKLSPNEVRRQGFGSFNGGENLTVQVECPTAFSKNFSIVAYSGQRYVSSSNSNFTYTFTAGADYYEAIFSNATQAGLVDLKVVVTEPEVVLPFAWLTIPAKMVFLATLGSAMFATLIFIFSNSERLAHIKATLPALSSTNRRRILALVSVSLVCWLVLLAMNSNPLATFENWYTDHPRHSYSSSLFLKYGMDVFSQPLDRLASLDNSLFMFVTWPEMPHLYPLGSVLLFLPFGVLLQQGFDPVLVYKLEIALFLVVASLCFFFFLKVFLKKDLRASWKLVGAYLIYVALIIYAADGMFDSVPFLLSLFAITMLLEERYDNFFLLIGISVFFKYQTAIFLLPLIIYGALKLVQTQKFGLLRNKAVIAGAVFLLISGFTAYLSAPYLIQTRPGLIMNGVNAFSLNSQIPWMLQSSAVLLTLSVTLVYALYMLHRNPLLSMSALFLLVPTFLLPFFQNWYIPFIFVYILIPQQRKELEATLLWLIFMIAVLSFGASAFNPLQIIDNFRLTFGI